MTKTASQLEKEIAELVAGDADLLGKPELGKKIRKTAGIVKNGTLLGYTASGKPVHAPSRPGAPDTNNIDTFLKTKAKYPGWTKADHMDASNLFDLALLEADQAGDAAKAKTLRRWSSVHWDIGGRWTSPEFEARFDRQKSTQRSRELAHEGT